MNRNISNEINNLIHALKEKGGVILDVDDDRFKLDGIVNVDGQLYFKSIPVDFNEIIAKKTQK